MNRKPSGLTLSKAQVGFLQYKSAEGMSPTTLTTYEGHLRLWISCAGDIDVSDVTAGDLRGFIAWLRTEYTPRRVTGNKRPLSPKTIRNYWVTLCSFFTWAGNEFEITNPMKAVPAPRFEKAPVEAFSKEEVEALLKACKFTREADTADRRTYRMYRRTARRDQAIILTLLDTGLRASELCSLRIGDVDQKSGRVHIRHGVGGGAKFKKGRVVFLGKVARRALWRYLAERDDDDEAPLFTSVSERSLTPNALRILIGRLGDKSGVQKSHPHRFRHTFAITYLRAGGDLFTLQALLGHSSLEMVRHYAQIAEIDIRQAHRRASPADNWRL
ncbi:MAG: tyrosine-type recombinase/integrase [Anaerolineae bacterium]|nr:tyrosine-type recombinase/integrase [Anaerolineae bacterium]